MMVWPQRTERAAPIVAFDQEKSIFFVGLLVQIAFQWCPFCAADAIGIHARRRNRGSFGTAVNRARRRECIRTCVTNTTIK